MRKPRSGLVVAVTLIAALVMGSVSLGAGAVLPFYENFESPLTDGDDMSGVSDWSINGDPGASAKVQVTNVLEGSQGCATTLADLTLTIDSAVDAANVWAQIYTTPTPYEGTDPAITADSGVLSFFVTDSGKVRAVNESIYEEVGDVTTGVPLAFAVHADFDNGQYDLFVSEALGSAMTKLNPTPLLFNPLAAGSPDRLTEFVVKGNAVLDAIAFAKDIAPVVEGPPATPANVLVVAKDLTGLLNEEVSLQAQTYATAADAALGGALGVELLRAIDWGDEVTVRYTAYHSYTAKDPVAVPLGPWDESSAGGLDPTLAYINPGTPVWIKKANSGPFVMFSDYDAPTTLPKTTYGSDEGGGVNRLAWDKPYQSDPANEGDFGLGLVANDGDWLYLSRDGGSLLTRKGDVWRSGSGPALQRLYPGDTFWLIRRSPGQVAWDIEAAQ